jgi:hypothetical protein
MTVTRAEAEHIAAMAADKAVEGVFLRLGVDTKNPVALAAWQDNFSFLGRINTGAKLVKATTIRTGVGAVFAGCVTLIVLGFKDWIFK